MSERPAEGGARPQPSGCCCGLGCAEVMILLLLVLILKEASR